MYRIFNYLLDSSIPLPELPEVHGDTADFTFCLASKPCFEEPEQWLHHWRSEGIGVTISFTRSDRGYLLRFPAIADFLINPACNMISGYAFNTDDLSSVRHVLLDQVIPRMVSHRGEVVLHASAVLHDQKALGFMGNSGAGKSTMAAAFHNEGKQVLTDDCLLLRQEGGQVRCIPAYVGTRLWDDSYQAVVTADGSEVETIGYSGKRRIQAAPLMSEPVEPALQLQALFSLHEAEDPEPGLRIEKAKGSSGTMELIKRSFMLDVHDMDEVTVLFNNVTALLKSGLPIFILHYPHDYSRLDEVRKKIIKTVNGE